MEDLDIFIIAGQSNAVGCTNVDTLDKKHRFYYAPHVYLYEEGNFAYYYTNRIIKGITCNMGCYDMQMGIEYGISYRINGKTNKTIGLIRYAYGGTTLFHHWKPDYKKVPDNIEDYGSCYFNFCKTMENGLKAYRNAGFNPIIRGMVWMQGETDAVIEERAIAYKNNLEHIFSCFRKELNIPDLKIIVGEIATRSPLSPFSDIVRESQKQVCEKDKNCVFLSTKNIKIGHDSYHFDGNEDFKLGKKFGDEMLRLIDVN